MRKNSSVSSRVSEDQYLIKQTGFGMILLFEGRDAAGKGERFKRIRNADEPPRLQSCCPWHPRSAKTQWYLQRLRGEFPQPVKWFLRSKLVTPRWCGAGDGILHGRAV